MRIHDVFHVSLLKPYKDNGSVEPPPPPELIDGELEYEVETILAHITKRLRGRNTTTEYLVKWTGYKDEHNSWEPEESFRHSREAVSDYWGHHGLHARAEQRITRKRAAEAAVDQPRTRAAGKRART
jgi:hypothetical protein